jgi:hypothetical protein
MNRSKASEHISRGLKRSWQRRKHAERDNDNYIKELKYKLNKDREDKAKLIEALKNEHDSTIFEDEDKGYTHNRKTCEVCQLIKQCEERG